MDSRFTDTTGSPLTFVPVEINESETTATFEASVPCFAGRVLKASPDAGLSVTARRTSSGDAFQNIEAAPIDLTPFAGQSISFDFRIAAGNVSDLSPLQAVVSVSYA